MPNAFTVNSDLSAITAMVVEPFSREERVHLKDRWIGKLTPSSIIFPPRNDDDTLIEVSFVADDGFDILAMERVLVGRRVISGDWSGDTLRMLILAPRDDTESVLNVTVDG